MRILSKYNRLTVIAVLLLVLGIIAWAGTYWYQFNHQHNEATLQRYLSAHQCVKASLPEVRGGKVFECYGAFWFDHELVQMQEVSDGK